MRNIRPARYVRASHRVWIASVLLAAVGACSKSDGNPDGLDSSRSTAVKPGDTRIVPRAPIEHALLRPDGSVVPFAETSYNDGNPTHYADGSPAYMPDGTPIDYRPRNIQMQLAYLPTIYLIEGTKEQVVLSGEHRNPRVDPASGELCWRAYECKNPDCSGLTAGGEPNLYAPTRPGVSVSEAGKVAESRSSNPRDASRFVPSGDKAIYFPKIANPARLPNECPVCSDLSGEAYVPATIVQRRKELEAELTRLRGGP